MKILGINLKAVGKSRKNKEQVKKRVGDFIRQNRITMGKIYAYYFFKNWAIAPITTLKLLLIVVFIIVLYWPAWLINAFPTKTRLHLNDKVTRKYYFTAYGASLMIIGLSLTHFFN